MTPVNEALLRVIVAWVVTVLEDVPIDTPEGSTVDSTAGEKVPKLMSPVDESRPGTLVALLRSTDKDSGIPEVVRSEGAAVGVRVSVSTPMTVSSVETSDELDVEELAVEVLEDSSGPRPSDKVMAEAVVEGLWVLVLDVVSDAVPRVVSAVEMPLLGEDNVVSLLDVPLLDVPLLLVVSLLSVPLLTAPGVNPDTTPGVESELIPGVKDLVDVDRDTTG